MTTSKTDPRLHSTTCPLLRKLYLQNSLIGENLLSPLINCSELEFLHLKHVAFQHDSNPAITIKFFERLRVLTVFGMVEEFMRFIANAFCPPGSAELVGVHSPQFKLLNKLYLDGLHRNVGELKQLYSFLQLLPSLRELCLERVEVNLASLLQVLSKHNRSLSSLHLHHIKLVNNHAIVPGSTPASDEGNGTLSGSNVMAMDRPRFRIEPSIPFSSLTLSSILVLNDKDLIFLLALCGQQLQSLTLSFCGLLSDDGYYQIARLCPSLRSLQIEDKRENWEGNQFTDRVGRVSQFFQQISRVRIVLWKGWLVESEKEKHESEREVVYERW